MTQHKEKIANLADHFAIKNYVISETVHIPEGQTFEESFVFDGLIFVLCLKGEATFKVNHKEHTLSEGAVFTLLPGQIFRIVQQTADLFIETLFLSYNYVLQLPLPKDFDLIKSMGYAPVQHVTEDVINNLLELYSIISKYHNRADYSYRDLQVKGLVFALMIEFAGVYRTTNLNLPTVISRQEQLTEHFFQLLIKHHKQERNVAFYAEKLYLTPKYLSMTVKKVTGHSILSWINEVTIIEAKNQLKVTDKTVLQISEEMNFPNPSFFGHFFKQHTGMTPMQYKRS